MFWWNSPNILYPILWILKPIFSDCTIRSLRQSFCKKVKRAVYAASIPWVQAIMIFYIVMEMIQTQPIYISQLAYQRKVFQFSVIYVISVPHVHRPWSDCPDVKTEVFLMWCWCQGKGVIFTFSQLKAGNPHPLSRLILKVQWTLENKGKDFCKQRFGNVTMWEKIVTQSMFKDNLQYERRR